MLFTPVSQTPLKSGVLQGENCHIICFSGRDDRSFDEMSLSQGVVALSAHLGPDKV